MHVFCPEEYCELQRNDKIVLLAHSLASPSPSLLAEKQRVVRVYSSVIIHLPDEFLQLVCYAFSVLCQAPGPKRQTVFLQRRPQSDVHLLFGVGGGPDSNSFWLVHDFNICQSSLRNIPVVQTVARGLRNGTKNRAVLRAKLVQRLYTLHCAPLQTRGWTRPQARFAFRWFRTMSARLLNV